MRILIELEVEHEHVDEHDGTGLTEDAFVVRTPRSAGGVQ